MVSTVFQVLDQKKSRILDDYAGSSSEGKKNVSKTECYVYIVVATIISFAVGILVSYAVSTGTNVDPAKIKTERLEYAERFVRSTKVDIAERLLDEISADRIRGFLKNLTSTPKVAGTRINRLGAEMMQRMWLDHGLPNVKLNPYDVLLAYPNPRRPSSVTILSESGDIVFRTNVSVTTEEDLDLGRRLFPSFNAYSAAGKIKADLVYVNYGKPVDYALLRDRGIDVKGKLLLIRYGGAVRSTTVATAQRQGAAGVILYSDPIDFTVKKGKGVYPESVNLPPDGVQSGCIKEVSSDPLTPGYPATESAYRITIEQAKAESYIPSILIYPIGYGDAQELLKRLDGSQVPDEWKGGLDLIYKTGPGLMNGSIVQLEVNDELKRKIITNVIGTIPGSVEPDRYVIIGNHRDSWTYGACDPSSGTACLVELTRAFGQMYKKGWRPKRTIIFCSWDGEEFGYVGSTEWVKEHRFILDRAVIYLNVDQAVTGNEAFYPRSIPGLSNIIYDIAKMVPNPNQDEANAGRTSVYDTWSLRRSKNSDHVPEVSLLRVGSDFYPFIHHHGIAAIDIRFADKSVSIPLYHTKYEVFDLEDKLLDKGFKYHRALSQIWAMLAISFSEQPVLPLNTTECGTAIEHHYKMLKHKYGDLVKKHNLSLEYVDIAVEELVKTSKRFEELKSQLEAEDSLNLRRINDQMLRLGRSMVSIIVDGKYHPGSRNVLYGTSLADPHLLFGQLVSAVNGLKKNPESKLHKESAKKQISMKTSSTISDFGLSDVSIDRNKTYSRRECYMSLIVATIVSFVVGVLLGNVALTKPNVEQLRTKTEQLEYFERFVRINEVDVTEQLLDDVSATRIGEFLKNMTRRPTMAGTQSNRLEGEEIKKTWMDHGLPDVKLNPYDVLLAYPDPEKPSSVSILNESGDILFQTKASRVTEADVDLGRKPVPSFNAYSAAGNIKADLVYVNYGLPDDFTLLKKQGIDVEGKILLIRYGKMGRSSKVLFAEQQGAAGVILYSDPMDFSVKGAKGVYPESVNLPPDGVQSGSIKKMASDPLTPGYPATESAYRLDIEHVKGESGVPRIPVYPIGYGDAQELLKRLDGPEAPEQWKGGLEVVYKIGPGLMNNSIVRLEVNDELKRKVITNVIGTIPGSIEPDRYVIIGNHRDSWTNGACDPKSGTACLMELTRVFGQLYMQGWRPRRTIIFCSWDAEEYGYVGSTEWIEENRFIMDRAVVYLNVDQAVTGNRVFYARSVPGLFNIIHEITKMVPNPNEDEVRRGRVSVYDTWSILQSNESDYIPWIPVLNGGSDFYPFTHDYGIASADFRFRGYKLSSPLYHSKYELFDLQEKLLDKTFTYHRAVTQVWALLAITFSEPVLLPFNTAEYGATLKHNYEKLRSFYGELMKKHKLNLEYLETAVEAFAETTERFESIKSRLVTNDPFEIRRINDQMLRVGRSMISIEYQENYLRRSMNVFYGRSPTNRDGLLFGPLVIELDNLKQSPGSRLLDESVKKQISVLVYHLQSATLVLKNITR